MIQIVLLVKILVKFLEMGQVNQDYELVTAMPITFKIDGNLNVKDPKGRCGKVLETKLVITETPK